MYMKLYFLILLLVTNGIFGFSQIDYNGTWQGIAIRKGKSMNQSTLFYIDVSQTSSSITGFTREELKDSESFAVNKIRGAVKDSELFISQIVVTKFKASGRAKWCRFDATLTYDSITGYLKGDYISTDCRRVMGTVLLYRSDFELAKGNETKISQHWHTQLIKDLKEGLNAPEIRKIERENFKFEPVFFDFDKSVIRDEHKVFLSALIKTVKGHSDLRVKVTGHTDSDGSDYYNEGLSQARAKAIVDYFQRNGLNEDRLIFDFKGERNPIRSNDTSEGKQKNRRVDFEFI